MTGLWTIARREVFSFFVSPIAYVVLTVWLLYSGISFYMLASWFAAQPVSGSATLNPLSAFFGGTNLLYLALLVFAPTLSMRSFAEERSNGTLEALLTAPVSETVVVLGKYLAAVFYWCVLWLPTLLYVWFASQTGEDVIDPGVIAATYLGVFGTGLYYMGIGVLMSAVARNQVVAALLSFLALGGLFVLGLGEFIALDDERRELFHYVNVWSHMEGFARGIVDTRVLVFDLSLAALSVFVCVRVLAENRWQ